MMVQNLLFTIRVLPSISYSVVPRFLKPLHLNGTVCYFFTHCFRYYSKDTGALDILKMLLEHPQGMSPYYYENLVLTCWPDISSG